MDNSDNNKVIVKKVEQRFMMLRERQEDMHRRYMEKLPGMRERENQEVSHARQFLRVPQANSSNKNTSKNKQYSGASAKMTASSVTSNTNDQTNQSVSNNNNKNTMENFSNANGPNQQQQDLIQVCL